RLTLFLYGAKITAIKFYTRNLNWVVKIVESVLKTNLVNEYAFDFSRGYFYFSAGYFTCSKLHNSITVNRCRYCS
ncbi:hypothetical protein, partial [Phascolarctobacterium sp.]